MLSNQIFQAPECQILVYIHNIVIFCFAIVKTIFHM